MGNRLAENSLKRFLKRKVKVTLGLVVGFLITGSVGYGAEALEAENKFEEPCKEGNFYISDKKATIIGSDEKFIFDGTNPDSVIVEVKKEETLELKANKYYEALRNFTINGEGNIIIENIGKLPNKDGVEEIKGFGLGSGTNTITADTVTIKVGQRGISATGDNTISANDIVIKTEDIAYTYGIILEGPSNPDTYQGIVKITDFENLTIEAGRYGIQNAGTRNQENLIITGKTDSVINIKGSTAGIHQRGQNEGAKSTISAGTLNVTSNLTGISINMGKTDANKLDIDVNNLNVTGSTGISVSGGTFDAKVSDSVTFNSGKFDENGNFIKGAGNAISTSTNGKFILDKNENTAVKVNGNISSTAGEINLELTNGNSYVDGKITAGYTFNESFNDDAKFEFSNGAYWNNTGNSLVSNLELSEGVVYNNLNKDGDVNNITVDKLTGSHGIIYDEVKIKEDLTLETGSFIVKNHNEDTTLDVYFTGINADHLYSGASGSSREEFEKYLADKIDGNNGDKTTGHVVEGLVLGEIHSNIKDGGEVETYYQRDESYTVTGMKDLAVINLLSWRQEMSSLTKRMGELRDSKEKNGVWARVYAGEINRGSDYDNSFQTYQVGYDRKIQTENGDFFIGGFVSYTSGETDYRYGHGENESLGGGIYGSYLHRNGHYIDVVLKQSRLSNDIHACGKDNDYVSDADYKNWGTSIGVEYGRVIDINPKWYVEPQIEMMIGRVEGNEVTTASGVKIEKDDIYTMVGRVGTAVGYRFSEKGAVNAKVSMIKEFDGEIDSVYTDINQGKQFGATVKTKQDLGDTWAEFGVGINYRLKEHVSIYADVKKSGNAEINTKWQANVGMRYEF